MNTDKSFQKEGSWCAKKDKNVQRGEIGFDLACDWYTSPVMGVEVGSAQR